MVKRRNEEAVLLIQQTLPFAAQYYDSLIEKCLLVKASTIKKSPVIWHHPYGD